MRWYVLEAVGRHLPNVAGAADPVGHGVLPLFEVDVFGPAPAGQEVPDGGLVPVAAVVVIRPEDRTGRYFLLQRPGLEVVPVD